MLYGQKAVKWYILDLQLKGKGVGGGKDPDIPVVLILDGSSKRVEHNNLMNFQISDYWRSSRVS